MTPQERKEERAKRIRERSNFDLREQREGRMKHLKRKAELEPKGFRKAQLPDPDKGMMWWMDER